MKILNLNEGSFPIEIDLNLNSIDVPDVGILKDTLDVIFSEMIFLMQLQDNQKYLYQFCELDEHLCIYYLSSLLFQ